MRKSFINQLAETQQELFREPAQLDPDLVMDESVSDGDFHKEFPLQPGRRETPKVVLTQSTVGVWSQPPRRSRLFRLAVDNRRSVVKTIAAVPFAESCGAADSVVWDGVTPFVEAGAVYNWSGHLLKVGLRALKAQKVDDGFYNALLDLRTVPDVLLNALIRERVAEVIAGIGRFKAIEATKTPNLPADQIIMRGNQETDYAGADVVFRHFTKSEGDSAPVVQDVKLMEGLPLRATPGNLTEFARRQIERVRGSVHS